MRLGSLKDDIGTTPLEYREYKAENYISLLHFVVPNTKISLRFGVPTTYFTPFCKNKTSLFFLIWLSFCCHLHPLRLEETNIARKTHLTRLYQKPFIWICEIHVIPSLDCASALPPLKYENPQQWKQTR